MDGIRDERIRREVGRRLGMGMGERHGKACAWRVRSSPGTSPAQGLDSLGRYFELMDGVQKGFSRKYEDYCIRCCRVVLLCWLGSWRMSAYKGILEH